MRPPLWRLLLAYEKQKDSAIDFAIVVIKCMYIHNTYTYYNVHGHSAYCTISTQHTTHIRCIREMS